MTKEQGNASFEVTESGTLDARMSSASKDGYARGNLYIMPNENTLRTDASKSVVTLKFKPYYLDYDGNKYYSNYSQKSYIVFDALAKETDGSYSAQRIGQWDVPYKTATTTNVTDEEGNQVYDEDGNPVTETTYTNHNEYGNIWRGAAAGTDNYLNQFNKASVDKDGYYYFRIESYQSGSDQYVYLYDMNNYNYYVGYHYYPSTAAKYADSLGHGIKLNFWTTSEPNDRGVKLGVEIKNLEMHYEYSGKGSVTDVGTARHIYDYETDTYTVINGVTSSAEANRVNFNATSAMSTGYTVFDFSLKKEDLIYNELKDTGAGYGGDTRQIRTASGTAICTFAAGTYNVGAYTSGTAVVDATTGERKTSRVYTLAENNGWYDLRVVGVRGDGDGKWGYAFYDRNKSLDKPLFIRYTNETTFKGMALGWYITDSNGRKACAGDSTRPKTYHPIVAKNVELYTSDDYDTYAFMGRSGKDSTTYAEKNVIDDGTAIRWDCVMFVSSTSTAKAVLAVYDAEGKEVGKTEKILANGMYDFNSSNPFTVAGLTDAGSLTAKMYLYNGSEWVTSAGEYKDSRVTFADSKAEYGWANEGDANKTLRFIFTPSFSNLLTPDGFGAYIIPNDWWLKDSTLGGEGGLIASSVGVEPAMTIDSGEEYAIDLGGIPEKEESSEMVAIPFIILDGEYVYGDIFKTKIIDALVEGSAQ